MPVRPVTDYLDRHNVNYHSYNHPPAITAQEIAQSAHISGNHLAKTVIVNGDGELAMAVLPANQKINPQKLQAIMGATHLRIAGEYARPDDATLVRSVRTPYVEVTTIRGGQATIARGGKSRTFSLS